MAHTLSDDPHEVLAESYQEYQTQFEDWYARVGKDRLWEEAGTL